MFVITELDQFWRHISRCHFVIIWLSTCTCWRLTGSTTTTTPCEPYATRPLELQSMARLLAEWQSPVTVRKTTCATGARWFLASTSSDVATWGTLLWSSTFDVSILFGKSVETSTHDILKDQEKKHLSIFSNSNLSKLKLSNKKVLVQTYDSLGTMSIRFKSVIIWGLLSLTGVQFHRWQFWQEEINKLGWEINLLNKFNDELYQFFYLLKRWQRFG